MGARRTMKIRLDTLLAAAAKRPAGYLDDVISRGTVAGDHLEIEPMAMDELRRKYRETSAPAIVPPPRVPDGDQADYPAILTMAKSALKAGADEIRAVLNRATGVSDEEILRREQFCRSCEHFVFGQKRCKLCGCFAALKSRMRSQHCPIGKW